jgi:hypothetical protein
MTQPVMTNGNHKNISFRIVGIGAEFLNLRSHKYELVVQLTKSPFSVK